MDNGSTVIRHMVDSILQGNNTDSLEDFKTVISDKISDSLEIRKREIASSLGEKDEDTE